MGVVCQMYAFQQKVTVSDYRTIGCVRAPVKDHFLPYGIVITDFQEGILTLEFKILRSSTDDGTLIDDIIRSHTGATENTGIRHDRTIVSDFDILVDIGKRMNGNIRSDPGFFIYIR